MAAKNYSVVKICKMLQTKQLKVPEFQRALVWSPKKQKGFIEFILDGSQIPIPPITISRRMGEKQSYLLDGKQRVSTLASFLNDGFKLSSRYENRKFSELSDDLQERIQEQLIYYNEVALNEQQEIDYYQNLNSGKPLNKTQLEKAQYIKVKNATYREMIRLSRQTVFKKTFTTEELTLEPEQLIMRAVIGSSLTQEIGFADRKIAYNDAIRKKFSSITVEDLPKDELKTKVDRLCKYTTALENKGRKNIRKGNLHLIALSAMLNLTETQFGKHQEALQEIYDDTLRIKRNDSEINVSSNEEYYGAVLKKAYSRVQKLIFKK